MCLGTVHDAVLVTFDTVTLGTLVKTSCVVKKLVARDSRRYKIRLRD